LTTTSVSCRRTGIAIDCITNGMAGHAFQQVGRVGQHLVASHTILTISTSLLHRKSDLVVTARNLIDTQNSLCARSGAVAGFTRLAQLGRSHSPPGR
jgi:hypothetical protein